MSLTHCPKCQRLSFHDAASCASCGQAFRTGELPMTAAAEERVYMRKCRVLFLVPFLAVLTVSFFAAARG